MGVEYAVELAAALSDGKNVALVRAVKLAFSALAYSTSGTEYRELERYPKVDIGSQTVSKSRNTTSTRAKIFPLNEHSA